MYAKNLWQKYVLRMHSKFLPAKCDFQMYFQWPFVLIAVDCRWCTENKLVRKILSWSGLNTPIFISNAKCHFPQNVCNWTNISSINYTCPRDFWDKLLTFQVLEVSMYVGVALKEPRQDKSQGTLRMLALCIAPRKALGTSAELYLFL